MKKIAIITSMHLPLPAVLGGGVEWLIQTILDENEKNKEYEFEVFCLFHEEAEKASRNYKFTRFIYLKKNTWYYRYYGYLKKVFKNINYFLPFQVSVWCYLRRIHADEIIVENNMSLVPSAYRGGRKPVIFHLHNDTVNCSLIPPEKNWKMIKDIWCVSDFIGKQVRESGIIEPEKIHILPNCSCLKLPENSIDIRKKYGIEKDEKILLYTGRIIPEKGILELVKAFGMAEFQKKVKLFIIGGINYSSNVQNDFLKQVKEIANENVIFTGYIPYEDIYYYYNEADAAIVPTLYVEEAASLAVIEALTLGIPVIASDSGGIWNYADQRCGIKVFRGPDFIKRLSVAMSYIISADEDRKLMSYHCKMVAEKFTRKEYFKKFCELIG